jgi:hypothetical protein
MRKAAILLLTVANLLLGSSLISQDRSGNFCMAVQAGANFTNFSNDFEHLASRNTWYTRYRIREYHLSLDYIIRTGSHTAIDLELGYRFLNAQISTGEASDLQTTTVTDAAAVLIPHFMLSFNPVDSVLVPYLRAGIGLIQTDSSEGEHPLIYSIGAGGMYLASATLFFRGELNIRGHNSTSGSNTRTYVNWSAFTVFIGVGIRY